MAQAPWALALREVQTISSSIIFVLHPTPESPAFRSRDLSRRLVARGAVSTPAVAAAFERVDRAVFAPAGHARTYDDAPLRARDAVSGTYVHLSAPAIYGAALEALCLWKRGRNNAKLSFLNLGSGTGYLSALAAVVMGEGCVHVCVERDANLAARSRATLLRLGATTLPEVRDVRIISCSCFDLDFDNSLKFDRIYLGAGARMEDADTLGRLLKPDGVMVGPFEETAATPLPPGAPQALVRVVRARESGDYDVTELVPVHFAPLVRGDGDADESGDDSGDEIDAAISAATPRPRWEKLARVRLVGPRWADQEHLFGADFRLVVKMLRESPLLPWDVLRTCVIPFLGHGDVAAAPLILPGQEAARRRRRDARFAVRPKAYFPKYANQIMGTLANRTRGLFVDSDSE